ncbi:MAG: EcsC family protein [Methylobacter sp.]|nr:EcsC family protein [Methylobacter sp.]
MLLVRSGEKIPTDGVVIQDISTADEAMVTRESLPVIKNIDHKVIGGCVNGSGELRIRVTAVGMDTMLAGIVHMGDQAQATKLPIQKQVDKISAVFVPSVMVMSGLTMASWLLVGMPFSFAFGNAITVLLISEKMAAQAVPAIGLIGGASVNLLFINHYQKMAKAHFTIRRLERRYGEELVKEAYMEIVAIHTENKSNVVAKRIK